MPLVDGADDRVEDVPAHVRYPAAIVVPPAAMTAAEPRPGIGPERRRAAVHVPVQPVGNRLDLPVLRSCPPGNLERTPRIGLVNGQRPAQQTAVVRPGQQICGRARGVRAVAETATVAADRLDHCAALADGARERLLAIDGLTSLGCHDGHHRVPVRRRADEHLVDVLPVEDVAEVGVALALGTRLLQARRESLLADVADGQGSPLENLARARPADADRGRAADLARRSEAGAAEDVARHNGNRRPPCGAAGEHLAACFLLNV